MKVRRLDPVTGFSDIITSIQERTASQETRASGNIVVREQLTTTDPNTGVSAVFGKLPDGTVGFQQFIGDTTPPPVPSTPLATSAVGIATIVWDGTFSMSATAPADYSHCNVYGQKASTTNTVLIGTVINPKDSINYTGVVGGDSWTFWLTSVDQNGNESAASPSTAVIVIASVLDDTGLAQKLQDNTTAIDNTNKAVALKSTVLSASAAPSGSHNTNDVWFNTSQGNKPYRWDGTAWVDTQDQAILTAQSTAVSAQNAATAANNTAANAQSTAASAQNAATSAQSVAASANALANTANNTANSAQTIANGKNHTFLTSTAPTASADGDLWVDLGAGRVIKSWSTASSAWVPAIQNGSISTTQIAADTITAGNIAVGAITASELAANSVSASALTANSITATALAAGSITASALAAQSITATALAAGSITASALAAQSITATALAAQSITATALAAQSITATALAAQSITATAMAAASVSATALQAGSVAASTIVARSITASALAANSITASAIAANSITASALGAASITASALAAGSITASAMAANSIGANQIQAGAINAAHIAATAIDGKTIVGADIRTSSASGVIYGHMGPNTVYVAPSTPAYSGIGFNVNGSGAFTYDAGLYSKNGDDVTVGQGGGANGMSYMQFSGNQQYGYSYGGTTLESRGGIFLNNSGPSGNIALQGGSIVLTTTNGSGSVKIDNREIGRVQTYIGYNTATGVSPGTLAGPGTVASADASSTDSTLISWPAPHIIQFRDAGIYALQWGVRLSASSATSGSVGALSFEDPSATSTSVLYSKGPINYGENQAAVSCSNIKVTAGQQFRCYLVHYCSTSITTYNRINVTRIG